MNNHSENIVKSSEVINQNVYDRNHEKIGNIEEIVLEKISGETRYVVLSFGGFLGIGDKYFAFPWKTISYSPQLGGFILHVDKEQLKIENGFSRDNWPDMASFESTVNTFFPNDIELL